MTSLATIRHAKKRAFLAAYAELGTITHAADSAGVDRHSHQNWLKSDPIYAEAFERAKDAAADRLEREAIRRAVEGVEEPVWHAGEQVGTVRKYSDTLLIFTLKALRPEKFRDRFDHKVTAEVTHHNGDSELDAEIARLMAGMAGLGEGPAALEAADSGTTGADPTG